MNILRRKLENYRIRYKRKTIATWVERLVLGIIIGVMAAVIVFLIIR